MDKPFDYRNLLMTDEEYEAYVERRFVTDDETGEILGERLTPFQEARLSGVNWYEEAGKLENPEDELLLEMPSGLLDDKNREDEHSVVVR